MKNFWNIYFELKGLTGRGIFTPSDWNNNLPRLVRYQMLISICTALTVDLKQIEEEEFKVAISPALFYQYLKKSKVKHRNNKISELIERFEESTKYTEPTEYQLTKLFYSLLKVRKNIYELESHFNGVLAASGVYILPIILNDSMSEAIQLEKKWIDDCLLFLMNTENVKVTKQNLIEKYQFPNVDLNEIDFDYF